MINFKNPAKIGHSQLNLSKSKCQRIHIKGSKVNPEVTCLEVKAHNEMMNESKQEKYLGDFIISSGTIRSTIEAG